MDVSMSLNTQASSYCILSQVVSAPESKLNHADTFTFS